MSINGQMSYKTKACQLCSKEYQPTNNCQKYCPECALVVIRIRAAKYRKANPEKNRAMVSKWQKANPEKNSAKSAKWNRAHPEKITKWQKENPDKVRASVAKWAKAHPEKTAVKGSKRRAAKYANTPLSEMLTSTEWLAILAEANGHCHYCDKETNLTLDHVIPLSKGGKHSKGNVVAACLHCNDSKGNKTVEEWRERSVRTC